MGGVRDEASLRSAVQKAGFTLTESEGGSRRKPDGSALHWVTFGYATLDHPLAPFFIVWADVRLHPSRTSPRGCKLEQLRIQDPPAGLLRDPIAALRVSVTVAQAREQRMRVVLSCPKGRVTFG